MSSDIVSLSLQITLQHIPEFRGAHKSRLLALFCGVLKSQCLSKSAVWVVCIYMHEVVAPTLLSPCSIKCHSQCSPEVSGDLQIKVHIFINYIKSISGKFGRISYCIYNISNACDTHEKCFKTFQTLSILHNYVFVIKRCTRFVFTDIRHHSINIHIVLTYFILHNTGFL